MQSVNNNTRDKELEFRCPQCYKLYRVQPKDIYSSRPQFECHSCHANFEFDYPPKNAQAIYTRSLSLPQVGKLAKLENPAAVPDLEFESLDSSMRLENRFENRSEARLKASRQLRSGPELKACPKCQTMNPRGVTECYKCGVVFAKADHKVGHLPSLMKMWQELLHDYNNMTKHMAFVDRCEELHALPFALKKYKELKEVQPQDSLAHQMLNSVLIKSLSRQASNAIDHRFLSFLKDVPYANLARISPLVLGAMLILIGLLGHGNRNFAGGGVAFLVLVIGFAVVLKGRLSWRDFWR